MPPIPVLVALADPTRCRILEILRDGPQPVHILAGSFRISRPAISRHLRVLKEAQLIVEKKAGRENRYALQAGRLKGVREWLEGFAAPQPAALKAIRPASIRQTSVAPRIAPPMAMKPVTQMGFDF